MTFEAVRSAALRRGRRILGGLLGTAAVVVLVPSAAFAAPQDLDPHFGGTGKVTTDVGPYDSAAAVAVDTRGRIVVAGSTGNGPQADFLVARYMPDGSLDGSFGNGGIVTTDFKGHDDRASSMRLDSRGRIVVGGTSRDTSAHYLAALARYRRDGTLDPSFSGDGKVLANLGNYDSETYAMVIDYEDRIVVAGRHFIDHQDLFDYYDVVVARFKSNGRLDPAFGTDGKVTTNWGQTDFAYALALDSQSRIIAAGESEFETSSFVVGRYTPDGDVDTSFGNQGFAGVRLGDGFYQDYAHAVALDDQGRVVAAGGGTKDTGESDFVLTRYDADGGPDPSFGTDGVVTTKFGDNAVAKRGAD